MLDFMYDGELALGAAVVVPLMELARRLQIPALGKKVMGWDQARARARVRVRIWVRVRALGLGLHTNPNASANQVMAYAEEVLQQPGGAAPQLLTHAIELRLEKTQAAADIGTDTDVLSLEWPTSLLVRGQSARVNRPAC